MKIIRDRTAEPITSKMKSQDNAAMSYRLCNISKLLKSVPGSMRSNLFASLLAVPSYSSDTFKLQVHMPSTCCTKQFAVAPPSCKCMRLVCK